MEDHAEVPADSLAGDELLTFRDAAKFLACPIGTLYGWVSQKRVPHIRLGRRAVRFSRRALSDWLARHSVAGRG